MILGVFALLSPFLILSLFSEAEAQSGQGGQTEARPVTGYAWSSTVGLIRFDHGRQNPVVIQPDNNFTGYAWSNNIGWIDFNPPGPYPTGGSNNSVRLSGDNVTGWARVCAGMIATGASQSDPNNVCSGSNRTDGWDGWILFDHNRSQPVTRNDNGAFEGFAWGSNVVGWVNMALAYYSNGGPPPEEPPCITDANGNRIANPAYSGSADCGGGGGGCDPTIENCPEDSYILTLTIIGDGYVTNSHTGDESDVCEGPSCEWTFTVPAGTNLSLVGNPADPNDNVTWLKCGNTTPSGDTCNIPFSLGDKEATVIFGEISGPPVDPIIIDNIINPRFTGEYVINCSPVSSRNCDIPVDLLRITNITDGDLDLSASSITWRPTTGRLEPAARISIIPTTLTSESIATLSVNFDTHVGTINSGLSGTFAIYVNEDTFTEIRLVYINTGEVEVKFETSPINF